MAPWIKIRIELYRQLENHVRLLLGDEEGELRRYREQFNREFEQSWRPSERAELVSEIGKSDVVLLADFHALKQSQKAHVRILQSVKDERPAILAVEFFNEEDQRSLESFLAGRMSEKDFLNAIDWKGNWGFPWEHYRPIVRFAQKKGIPIYGINRQFSDRSGKNLKLRDDFAADQILRIRRRHPDHRIFVIFGDMHLARLHLPKSLAKRRPRRELFRILTVFQNPEKIYFRLLEKEQELSVDVVRLSRDQFSLVSVPPWVKWQNYLMFLERHLDKELHGESIEYTDHVHRYLKILAGDFNLRLPVEDFSIYTAEDERFWPLLEKQMEARKLRALRSLVEGARSFYVPELKTGYLARPTVNHAAQLAMAILHGRMCGWKETPVPGAPHFLRMTWLETVQYFGSKMINPKRKTDTLHDMRAALASRNPGDLGQEALQLALHQKMRELLLLTGQNARWTSFRPRRAGSFREASRLLGGLLGEKLYTAYRQRLISLATLLNLFSKPVDGPDGERNFEKFYFEIIELVEGFPDPFLSKSDKM